MIITVDNPAFDLCKKTIECSAFSPVVGIGTPPPPHPHQAMMYGEDVSAIHPYMADQILGTGTPKTRNGGLRTGVLSGCWLRWVGALLSSSLHSVRSLAAQSCTPALTNVYIFIPVLGIRICMFLGLPDPDTSLFS
jgi:hypothetical protein